MQRRALDPHVDEENKLIKEKKKHNNSRLINCYYHQIVGIRGPSFVENIDLQHKHLFLIIN